MSANTLALRIFAGLALVVVLALGVGNVLLTRTDESARRADQNRAAIHANQHAILTSCNTLRDLFLRLGGEDRQSNEPPTEAQQLVTLRLSVLVRLMTPAERREHRRLLSYLVSHGGLATAPDCERIARP